MINIFKGFYDSLNIFKLIKTVNSFGKLKEIYYLIFFYNFLCVSFNIFLIDIVIPYFPYPRIPILLVRIFWTYPHYIITIIYNGVYTNEIVKLYIEKLENINLNYQCYKKYSEYIVNKFYYQLVVILLLFESTLLTNIPIYGRILDMIFSALVYSYYAWEYSWSHHKIPHRVRYDIFESNWSYYLRYGLIIGLIKYYFHYFTSYHLISIIFPLISINSLEKYQDNFHGEPSNNLQLPLFKLPIYYTKLIINRITKCIKYYENSK